MTLSEQIAALDDSSLPAMRGTLESMVAGTVPGDLPAAEREIRKLKLEAAIAKVDAELETAKQECMVRYRGSMRAPNMAEAYVSMIYGTAFVVFFLWLGVKGGREIPGGVFIGLGAATVLAYTIVTHTIDVYRKSRRLRQAKSQWTRARHLLVETLHP